MTLPAGSRLGPYEILSPLGAGGMGEVYRARDTRLERTVAIKVLPDHLASSTEVRQRFEREAKTISALSHPHICALYDVGREGETEYLVMEYLEGETLSDRLGRGAMPLEQTLRYGVEMADALDKAHRQGIVHRDLKPGNVMLTKSGVKLLDFGLAKAMEAPSARSSLTALPTAAHNLTAEGTILGTFQYMAPEQLEGKEADARTDIFAFGAVLYEMATGSKAFEGASQASLIASIMGSQPAAISTVQPMTPPALDRVVRTCFAKDPDERWQSAGDVAKELKWIAEAGSGAGAPAVVVSRRKTREWLAWSATAVAAFAAVAFAVAFARRAPPQSFRTRSFLLPPEKIEFETSGDNCASLTVSPDGRHVTFAAKTSDGKRMLWLRSLDELTGHPIPGTGGATFPFWSPDGRHLAFFSSGKLQRVDLGGAPPLAICDAPNGRSGSWNRDGVILFSPDTSTEIFQVPASGGAATPATKLDVARGEETHRWATFLPDGKRFLYLAASHSAGTKSGSNAIYLASLGSSERTRLLQGRSNVAYASGYLLALREQVLLAQRFDTNSGRLRGDPVPLADGVQNEAGYFRGDFSASETGVLVYATGTGVAAARLRWFDVTTGKPLGEPFGDPPEYTGLAVAPDGSRIAAAINDPATGQSEIWLLDVRGARTRLTFGGSPSSPVYSPDGSRVAYVRRNPQGTKIFVIQTSGGCQEALIYGSDAQLQPTDWSRDGRYIALDYLKAGSKTKQDVWILPVAGDRRPYPFLATDSVEQFANFSPDGRFISYISDESGRPELYVSSFPDPGRKWQISSNGSVGGSWDSAGGLLYGSLDGMAMSVEFKATLAGVEIGGPKTVFKMTPFVAGPAVPIDSRRFLLAVSPDRTESARAALVTNWTAGLPKE